MDQYFNCYAMYEGRKVWFAKMKSVSQARLYWEEMECDL